MRKSDLLSYREREVAATEGRVLEIGILSGLNLPFQIAQMSRYVSTYRRAAISTAWTMLDVMPRCAATTPIVENRHTDAIAARRHHSRCTRAASTRSIQVASAAS